MRKGWEYKKLEDVCNILNGFAFKSTKYTESGIRIIRITNVQKGYVIDNDPKFYSESDFSGLNQYSLYDGDLVMSLTGNVGRVGIMSQKMMPAALNQRVACLRRKTDEIDTKYLFHLLNSDIFEYDAVQSARGIAQLNMSTEWLKNYFIPVPPKSTQLAIVSELDKINELIRLKKEQLVEYDNLAQSIFYEMFGDPVENEKGWEVKKLGDLATDIKYGTSKPACENGKYKYLRMCNLTYEGYLDLTDIKTIDIPDDEIEKCIVRKGDILFNRTNSIELVGKTCMFDKDEPMVIAGYIIRVRLSKELLPQYLSLAFNLPSVKKLLRAMAKGAVNQANINSKELASIKITVPPLPLQQSFASRIEQIEKLKSEVQNAITDLETLLASRMQYWFE